MLQSCMARLFLQLCLLFAVVQAQYFSEGWAPGNAVPSSASTDTVGFVPQSTASSKERGSTTGDQDSWFDIGAILSSKPFSSLFSTFGVNITQRVQEAQGRIDANAWDPRIPLITDDNYREVIVEEKLTPKEEDERLWFLIITTAAGQPDGIAKFADKQFDDAYEMTQAAGNDLPHVKWGRIDYLNVTMITTKWGVWRGPYFVVLHDRGQTLRFYPSHAVRLQAENLRAFLLMDGWKSSEPWSGVWAPGGQYEWLLDRIAVLFTKAYDSTVGFPRWVFMVLTGVLGSSIVQILHYKRPQKSIHTQQPAEGAPSTGTTSASTTAANSTKTSAKKRKAGK